MKEDQFKKVVAEACRVYSFNKLIFEKKKLSKGRKLIYNDLNIQKYLTSDLLSVKEAKLLFKIRVNVLDFRANFKTHYIKLNKK